MPLVYGAIALRGGLLAESPAQAGYSQLMSEMLTRGTASRSAQDIAAEVEQLGATLAPFAGRNSFGLQVQCLARDLPALMDLAADCLFHSVFPETELEKLRSVQLAEIRQQYERPFFVAEQALREILFPDHPYRWTPPGEESAVQKVSRADIAAFHKKLVTRANIAIAVFGDVAADDARALAERFFGQAPEGAAPTTAGPAYTPPPGAGLRGQITNLAP